MDAIFRVPQYPKRLSLRLDKAVCLGARKQGEVLEDTLTTVREMEARWQLHLKPEARKDPAEYCFIAKIGFEADLAKEFGQ